MRKSLYLLFAIALSIFTIVWKYYLGNSSESFFCISKWGIYLLTVPFVFCISVFFTNTISTKILFYISLGVITSILLNIDLTNSFWLQKIIATVIGALLAWLFFSKLDIFRKINDIFRKINK